MDRLADSSSSDGDVVQQFLRNLCEWLSAYCCIGTYAHNDRRVLCVLLRWYSSDHTLLRMDACMQYAPSST